MGGRRAGWNIYEGVLGRKERESMHISTKYRDGRIYEKVRKKVMMKSKAWPSRVVYNMNVW